MLDNDTTLRGTVISVSESDDRSFQVRIYCRVQVISIELPEGSRKPELGEDVTLNGKLHVRSFSPTADNQK